VFLTSSDLLLSLCPLGSHPPALNYYDSYRRGSLPANLTQAQRVTHTHHTPCTAYLPTSYRHSGYYSMQCIHTMHCIHIMHCIHCTLHTLYSCTPCTMHTMHHTHHAPYTPCITHCTPCTIYTTHPASYTHYTHHIIRITSYASSHHTLHAGLLRRPLLRAHR
jgi:hypothetical protein